MTSQSNRPEGMPGGSGFAAASDGSAAGAGRWLSLAAAPTFAFMALLTMVNGQMDMMCSAMPETFPLGGMAPMYLLMSIFHLTPWLRLFAGRAAKSR